LEPPSLYDVGVKLTNLPLGASLLLGAVVLALVAGALGYATAGDGAASSRFDTGEPVTAPYTRGVVQSVNGDTLTLTTSEGPLTLKLVPSAPIEALRPVAPSTLTAGDWLNGGAMPHQQTLLALTAMVAIAQGQQGLVPK
jgi:hypothetical protein